MTKPDYAGLVYWTRARSTGRQVGVYNGAKAGLDTDGGEMPWSTVCEDHAGICSHRTRRLAISFASCPEEWCPECQDERRCPSCNGQIDWTEADMGTCVDCGDEWSTDHFASR